MLSRKETLLIGYTASEIDFPYKIYNEALRDWHVKPIEVDGETVGMFVHKGPHIHISVLPKYRNKWMTRRFLKDRLAPLFKVYGYLETSIPDDKLYNPRLEGVIRMILRFGFTEFRRIEEKNVTVFRLTESKVLQWV